MSIAQGRLPAVDVAKVLASQAIVLHHLALYGPMSDHAWPLATVTFEWLARHARLAVQVFLVIAGFLAARQLAPNGRWLGERRALASIVDRYLRLVLPYAAVLVLSVVAAAIARSWMTHDSIPAPASAGALIAHLLLLQDVLGIEALSAGVWYLAIDLQLYALLIAMLLLANLVDTRWRASRGAGPAAPWLVTAGVALSLLVVNRHPAWDIGAPYFLGAYGLGVLAAWWSAPSTASRRGLPLVAALVIVALLVEWRSRVALAAITAMLLALTVQRWPTWSSVEEGGASKAITSFVQRWSDRSYALFLIHFPVALLINAAFARWVPHTPWPQMAGVLLAWAASLVAATVLHRRVEQPLSRWQSRRMHHAPLPA